MLRVENTVLVLIDVQGKLFNSMYEKEALLENTLKLVKGLQVLGVPVVVTEQNPAGLGPTLPELNQLFPGFQPIPKFSFSCCDEKPFTEQLGKLNRKQVLIAGIEMHVCVYQTAVDLLKAGYEVQVVADAVSSRTLRNKDLGLQRVASEGVKLTGAEMALFELLGTAQGPKFKEMLKVVK